MQHPVWKPTAEQVAATKMTAFLQELRQRGQTQLHVYPDLYEWSVTQPAEFWQAVWDFCGVVSSRRSEVVCENFQSMTECRWFTDARLNFAENLLRFSDDRRALVLWNESGFCRSLTFAEVGRQTAQLARTLRSWGITPGDRVAGFLPNIPEAVIAMLAVTSLGAIWSSCSPDFGLQGLTDRFGQIEPKVLFAADSYLYNGSPIDCLGRVSEAVQRIQGIERTVIIPYLQPDPNVSGIPRVTLWSDALDASTGAPPEYAQLPFGHPVYILFSSGTTGLPKCIVHSAGGVLLQHLKELILHCDLRRDDRIFYFTTCGWMMWNWLVSSLAVGCAVHLYDGSPLAPRPEILFDMAEAEQITVFGTSPKYLVAVEKAGVAPKTSHQLNSLRLILSTGAPLNAESYDYVYEHIRTDVQLSSISGGTDLCSCFALGNPTAPVWRGELQTRGLGMSVRVFDDGGRELVGRKGELVCTAPFPAMPCGFWKDESGTRYHRTYFELFPGVWNHGDFAELTERGSIIIYGRSDAVLNPGGVRIGTAEISRQVEQIPDVIDCVVVGQEWQNDIRIILFVRLRSGLRLTDELTAEIRSPIRRNTTPRHVPAKLVAVADIPRTRSGKTVELAVRDVIHGRPISNLDALANPESLELFRDLPELQS